MRQTTKWKHNQRTRIKQRVNEKNEHILLECD